MQFLVADSFTDSLGRLTADEQKAVKTTAFDLQLNPAHPSHQLHRLDKARDKQFWSVRASSDIRLILHKSDRNLVLCYVGHHDDAYQWAERRKLDVHPRTGAAQFVEIRERVEEVVVPVYVPAPTPTSSPLSHSGRLFADVSEADLLGYGVPPEWLEAVREATEASLLDVAEHLPAEAAEALLVLATGGQPGRSADEDTSTPQLAASVTDSPDPFAHPDAQRRFRLVTSHEALQQALDASWDKWTIFLHPDQQDLVTRSFQGPARIGGSAGTGKTVVAMHRAVSLTRRHPEARVLLATFSEPLAEALRQRARRLMQSEPRLAERLDVASLLSVAMRHYRALTGQQASLAAPADVHALLAEAAATVPGHGKPLAFLRAEWEHIIDAWQIRDWEAYRTARRLGRQTQLSEAQRRALWPVFARVHEVLDGKRLLTVPAFYAALTQAVGTARAPLYDCMVIDEAQDLSVAQLRWLAAMGGGRSDALFFAGDIGQRIFQQPFSWLALGVDVRGRSRTLRVNYRTSHQIRAAADRLLEPVMTDVDGHKDDRSHTVSVFSGPAPVVTECPSPDAETQTVAQWLRDATASGVAPQEIGVFVRSSDESSRAHEAVKVAGLSLHGLDAAGSSRPGHVSISTMHLAKGLEFRAVVVMACDEDIIPHAGRLGEVGDPGEMKATYDTERQLLYVACTRARDMLLVTGVTPASEFLGDLSHVATGHGRPHVNPG
jgi:hypothetical protein